MRKKSGFHGVVLALAVLAFTGCATFNMAQLEVVDKAALVSVYCDKRIDMSDFKGVAAFVSQLAQDESFDLSSVALQMKDDVFEKYAPYLPFTFLDERVVTGDTAYVNLYPDRDKIVFALGAYRWMVAAAGYHVIEIGTSGKKARAYGTTPKDVPGKLYEAFPVAEALMFVHADFKLAKESSLLGFGTARMQANHHLLIINKNEEVILSKMNFAVSDDKIKFALGGIFDASKIQQLCVEALNKASAKTNIWILKEMTK